MTDAMVRRVQTLIYNKLTRWSCIYVVCLTVKQYFVLRVSRQSNKERLAFSTNGPRKTGHSHLKKNEVGTSLAT
jgi:hypothetical protein